MESTYLKYQAVIFTDVNDIAPSTDNLTYFLDQFRHIELFPDNFQEIDATGATFNRFGMRDSAGIWNVEFSSNRIDISKISTNVNIIKIGNKIDFLNEVKGIITSTLDKFPKKAYRLAFVTTRIFWELTPKEHSKVFSNLFIPFGTPDTFENRVEWGFRNVSRINKKIKELTESHNVITEINRLNGNLNIDSSVKDIERLEIRADINTFHRNSEYRFGREDMIDFFRQTIEWEQEIAKEVDDHIFKD